MAFSDNPNVDISSQASDESVVMAKQMFLQKNGFLVREENPDKGVDFDVELIIDGQVSGFKFAIQIKSAQQIQTIQRENTSYISYSIKTSRLGYLCRRSPGFGLIVVYDVRTQELYYDFVEDIFGRIVTVHSSDDWMQNESVTFHIPAKNVLDNASVKTVHEKMKLRCSNFNQMYARKALDFDLPTFESNKLNDPVSILEKYGYIFFNKREYQVLYSLLSEMSLTKIVTNPKILLLSAITYFHIGQNVEGDYFLKKCEAFLDQYNDEEKELLQISKLIADFSLGKMTRTLYYEKLKELKANIKGALNSIYVTLQISFMEILNTSIYDEKSLEDAFAGIDAIQAKIDSIDVPEETRHFYLLEVASLIHEIGVRHFLESSARMMIQKRMLGDSPLSERIDNAKVLFSLMSSPQKILQLIMEFSKRTKNVYMEAIVLFKRAYMFHGFAISSLMSAYANGTGIQIFKDSSPPELFEQTYKDILEAYNIFRQRRDLSNAYKCLSLSIEINCLFSYLHNGNIDDEAYKQTSLALESLEKELNIGERYKPLTEKTLIDLIAIKEKEERNFDSYSSLSSEEQKYQFANMLIRSSGLPPERIANLISEINFMQKAKDALDLKYFEVLQNLSHAQSKETMYKEAPRYVIRCKNCNYETIESDDLEKLLSCLQAEHRHICL